MVIARSREMFDEPAMTLPTFYSQEASAGGPDRLKLQSYRSSPYGYSPRERKVSPKEGRNDLVPMNETRKGIRYVLLF